MHVQLCSRPAIHTYIHIGRNVCAAVKPDAAPFFCLDLTLCHQLLTAGFKLAPSQKITLVRVCIRCVHAITGMHTSHVQARANVCVRVCCVQGVCVCVVCRVYVAAGRLGSSWRPTRRLHWCVFINYACIYPYLYRYLQSARECCGCLCCVVLWALGFGVVSSRAQHQEITLVYLVNPVRR